LRSGRRLLLEGPLRLHGSGERLQMARLREPHLHGAYRQREVLRTVRQVVWGARRGPLSHVGSGPHLHAHAVHAGVGTRLRTGASRNPGFTPFTELSRLLLKLAERDGEAHTLRSRPRGGIPT